MLNYMYMNHTSQMNW